MDQRASAVLAACKAAVVEALPDWRPWTLATPDSDKIVSVLCSPDMQPSVTRLYTAVGDAVKEVEETGRLLDLDWRTRHRVAFEAIEELLRR